MTEDDWLNTPDSEQIEQAMRWRLILGRYANDQISYEQLEQAQTASENDSNLEQRLNEAQRMDIPLEYIYDREYAQRSHRTAGNESSGLSVPMWLSRIRTLFPNEAIHVMEQDALTRYGLTELITDADILRNTPPSEDLLKVILQFKHQMHGEVLEAARELVKTIAAQIAERLLNECWPALYGNIEPSPLHPPLKNFRNTDWHKTIQRNLKHYHTERECLVVERLFYKHKQRLQRSNWHIIIAVDQSGSMTDSLIHSAVMAAIFATLPSLKVDLILWDTRIVNVSHLVNDPMEVLMRCQLGGGTEMWPAMRYCADLITDPTKTIMVLLSDWYLWGEEKKCLALAQSLNEAGITGIGLSALDSKCAPIYDENFASKLAGCGWFVSALTPKQLTEHVSKIIRA